jgi:Spy/CpxP family protein refolding chaperone
MVLMSSPFSARRPQQPLDRLADLAAVAGLGLVGCSSRAAAAASAAAAAPPWMASARVVGGAAGAQASPEPVPGISLRAKEHAKSFY